ncbi:MAG: CvpA family protein [Phycisphaerae bacterium]|nr:CvpA family protein [Phycisphaerae bacterium]
MWFSLFAAALILAITFYQGLLGLFSAAINCLLTILAAALAFGLYEDVYYNYLLTSQPDEGRAIALVGIFVVSLAIMRVIVDLVIKDNMKFPIYADRIAGGVFGLFTALTIIGVLAAGIQMLPFDHQFLGFSRYAMVDASTGAPISLTSKDEKETQAGTPAKADLNTVRFSRRNLWLNPDGFAVAVASYLSDNALAGPNRLSYVHPELLDEEHWSRFTLQGQNIVTARKADAITVEACWELPSKSLLVVQESKDAKSKSVLSAATESKDKVPEDHKLIAVRAKLSSDANDDSSTLRFTTEQVRLFAKTGDRMKSYGLVGINATPENLAGVATKDIFYRLQEGQTVARNSGSPFNFVFEIPKDAEPSHIVFRRNARADVNVAADAPKKPLFAGAKVPESTNKNNSTGNSGNTTGSGSSGNPSGSGVRDGVKLHDSNSKKSTGGRTQRYVTDEDGSFFDDKLPFESPLTQYTLENCEVGSDKIIGGTGSLIAQLDGQYVPIQGSKTALKFFDVPADKRLLQLSVRRLQPGSLYGQVLDFVGQLANFSVRDDKGNTYRAIGTWGIATVGREQIFELVYYDQIAQDGRTAPAKLNSIRRDNMQTNYALYYLFQVPPGAKIVSFVRPRGGNIDLTAQNLVAPK